MDVKLTTQSAWLCSLALAFSLGEFSLATADEATASDAEVTTTIFITDDTASEPPSPPQSVKKSSAAGSVVFIEDAPTTNAMPVAAPQATITPLPTVSQPRVTQPAVTQPKKSAVRGDLKVVSNQQQQVVLEPVRPLSTQQPQQPPATIVQPIAVPETTIQQVAAVEREQPGDIQVAVHAEPVAAEIEAPQTVEQLLIKAHQLSLAAKTAGDYSQIIAASTTALRQGVQGDKQGFAHQLASWALNRRGQLRADAGEQDLAGADFQAALDFNPRNWRALHNRGVSFAQTSQFAEAFDDFNAVIQLNPKYAKAYANRATLYVQAKDLQSAIKDYELAIERDAQFATAHVGLGRVCHMLGRWDEAIEHFTSAVRLEPTSPDIVCSRGDLQADMGHYGEALADYARTIELDGEFAHAYRNGAWLLATCPDERYRDPENAVLGAQQAMEYSYGERHVALDTLAAALASNGQFEEAIAKVTEAVDLAPEAAKFTYLSRMQLYQENQPFRTEPVGDVSQVMYEASDK